MSGPVARASWGTVLALSGRYFAGRIDLLTRDRLKTVPLVSSSPFALAGTPDPEMQRLAGSGRSTAVADLEVRKDLADRLAASGADYLVVDNSAALLRLREVGGRFYTVLPGHDSDLMDLLWNDDKDAAREAALKPSHMGLTDELRSAYDDFVAACLEVFEPSRIILVRSRVARFWADADGVLAPTDGDNRDARFLEQLDSRFAERTGCLVSSAALGRVPSAPQWHSVDSVLRVAIEDDVVAVLDGTSPGLGPRASDAFPLVTGRRSVAGHVLRALKRGGEVDRKWLRGYFTRRKANQDDLLALAYLQQERPGRYDRLVQACVRRAVADPDSYLVARTRDRFERSLEALRGWTWCELQVPPGDLWSPEIVLECGPVVLRFQQDGAVRRVVRTAISERDAPAVVDGDMRITPLDLEDLLQSWPVYLERGRRGVRTAPRVEVADAADLVDTCSWLDWVRVLANESVVVGRSGARRPWRRRAPDARTDLSFVFDPNTRIGTVGGGLMDQVTHVALFDELCSPHGFDLYLDDFRYTWWRSHNGFEASRLAPELDAKRMTRLISPALLERFRTEVRKTRLPWVFSQSQAWVELGLREAFVVTRDYSNARRLVEIDPDFPFLVYPHDEDLRRHIESPPRPVTFFTTQHRIAIRPTSSEVLGRIFDYRHLEEGAPPEVVEVAAALRARPHVALHVRRGDYMNPHFDTDGWYSRQEHYIDAVRFIIDEELGTSDVDVAVFSDDLEFVEQHAADYGLDQVTGSIRFIRGNKHYDSIYDSYLMSLCPVIVGSVGFFAATTSLLAEPPSTFVRAKPGVVHVAWRREA